MALRFSPTMALEAKRNGKKLVEITAYDYSFAKIIDETQQIDMILVGDSLGMVMQGHSTTLPVTIDHSVYHTSIVSRAVTKAMVIADMPFMSYQVSPEQALKNAGRLIQEGNADAVKLEGAGRFAKAISMIVESGIPVQGHLGLTPQSINMLGGWKIQGKTMSAAERLLQQAEELVDAGVFSIVLEGMPNETAKMISESVSVPTIGIGAGPHCDGQVLVLHDLLGLSDFQPVFVKRYADLKKVSQEAISSYADEVRNGAFPGTEYTYKTKLQKDNE